MLKAESRIVYNSLNILAYIYMNVGDLALFTTHTVVYKRIY